MKKSTRLAAMALALGITVGSTSGCSNKKDSYLLQETIFDKTIVANVNGNIAFVRPESSRVDCLGFIEGAADEHIHYFDIISGQWITNSEYCVNRTGVLKNFDIEEMGSMLEYLTEEEMKKANEGSLTEDDIIAIMYRIKQSDDKSLTLTKER